MNKRRLIGFYRRIIGFLLLLEILWIFFPLGWHNREITEGAFEWMGAGSILPYRISAIVSDLFTVLFFVAYIGLWFLKAWARLLFLILCLVGAVFLPLYGLSVLTGYESMIGYIITLGDGFILCLSYMSPLRKLFRARVMIQ